VPPQPHHWSALRMDLMPTVIDVASMPPSSVPLLNQASGWPGLLDRPCFFGLGQPKNWPSRPCLGR
jgi:hypothetical protein